MCFFSLVSKSIGKGAVCFYVNGKVERLIYINIIYDATAYNIRTRAEYPEKVSLAASAGVDVGTIPFGPRCFA